MVKTKKMVKINKVTDKKTKTNEKVQIIFNETVKCDRKMLKTKNKKMAKRKVKEKNTKTSAKTQKVSNKT